MGLSLECTHNSRIQNSWFYRLPNKCHDTSYHGIFVTIYDFSSLSRYSLWNWIGGVRDEVVGGTSGENFHFRFSSFWGFVVFWTASFWLTSKSYIQNKLYVGNFVKNTLWEEESASEYELQTGWQRCYKCHSIGVTWMEWLMSRGFKRATENLMTSESVTKWSKMVRLVGMCCEACGQMNRKYNRKWTGSNPDHGKQISKRNVCEVATIT